MKIFFKLLLLAVIFTSCEDVEPTIYNGAQGENGTLISFSNPVYSLPVERNATGNLAITLNVSTVSSVDRVYNVEVIPSTSSSAANPATYTVPSSVTVPAGSYQGTLQITGTDNNLVDENVKTFAIRITNITNEDIDSNMATVNIFEVCPLQAEFKGTYRVQQTSSVWPATRTPFVSTGIYELVEGDNPYERTFEFQPYGSGFGFDFQDFKITFKCDFLELGVNRYDLGAGCEVSEGVPGPNIVIKPGSSGTPYNTADDSTFRVIITENASSACGGSPFQTTITFTKIVD